MRRSKRIAKRRQHEALSIWERNRQTLRRRSAEKRRDACHHSGFFVGAAGVITTPRSGNSIRSGANKKPLKFGGERICAEEPIVESARELHGVVAGMVVTAPAKMDDFSTLGLDVTLCCGHCRRLFRREVRRHNGVVKSWTRLLFVNPDTGTELEMTVAELLNLCGEW